MALATRADDGGVRAGLGHPERTGQRPVLKRDLDEQQGRAVDDVWTGSPASESGEATGEPPRKPVALLERIIGASSNEGDRVLDPSCGCATTLVAADRLAREWAGIAPSPLAARRVLERLRDDRRAGLDEVVHREALPRRTDRGERPGTRAHKHTLYARQEGICGRCRLPFPFRNMTVEHVVARSKGGSDHLDNLPVLCKACAATTGTGSQARLLVRLTEQGIRR